MSSHARAYGRAILDIAEAEGRVREIESDLFAFKEALSASHELQTALADRSIPPERRAAVVGELMAVNALPASVGAVSFCVAAGRGSELDSIIDTFLDLAATKRKKQVAEVRTAIELDETQVQALQAALSERTGKDIEVRAIVDPSVVGGVVVRIGDMVIDGSVAQRLTTLKEHL